MTQDAGGLSNRNKNVQGFGMCDHASVISGSSREISADTYAGQSDASNREKQWKFQISVH